MSDATPPTEPEGRGPEPLQMSGPLSRKPMSRRRRTGYAVALGLAIVGVVVVAVVAATRNDAPSPRADTLPAADQNAPAQLVADAKAINYHPINQDGIGTVEDDPAETAPATQGSTLLAVGATAPPFTLETPTGEKVSLSDFRGKAVLLEFFATWCPHCGAEAPHLAKLATEMPASKYAFVSIDGSNENAATVFAYHVYFKLPFPALLDPAPGQKAVAFPAHGSPGTVSRTYRIGFYPTFYVIDPKGRVTWTSDGEQPDALLKQELERAAGE